MLRLVAAPRREWPAVGELRAAVRVVRDLVVLHQRPDQAAQEDYYGLLRFFVTYLLVCECECEFLCFRV